MRLTTRIIVLLSLPALVLSCASVKESFKNVPRITKEELRDNINNADYIIIDVRIQRNWKASEHKITGAFREDFDDVSSWADKYPRDKTIVLYCA